MSTMYDMALQPIAVTIIYSMVVTHLHQVAHIQWNIRASCRRRIEQFRQQLTLIISVKDNCVRPNVQAFTSLGWWFSAAVTCFIWSAKLLYAGPG